MNTEVINPNLGSFPKTELLGFPILMIQARVSPETVHFDLHVYELKAEFGKKDTLTLVRDAGDLFMGTVISALPILPSGEDSIALERGDFEQTSAPVETMTLSEFEARYGAQS